MLRFLEKFGIDPDSDYGERIFETLNADYQRGLENIRVDEQRRQEDLEFQRQELEHLQAIAAAEAEDQWKTDIATIAANTVPEGAAASVAPPTETSDDRTQRRQGFGSDFRFEDTALFGRLYGSSAIGTFENLDPSTLLDTLDNIRSRFGVEPDSQASRDYLSQLFSSTAANPDFDPFNPNTDASRFLPITLETDIDAAGDIVYRAFAELLDGGIRELAGGLIDLDYTAALNDLRSRAIPAAIDPPALPPSPLLSPTNAPIPVEIVGGDAGGQERVMEVRVVQEPPSDNFLLASDERTEQLREARDI